VTEKTNDVVVLNLQVRKRCAGRHSSTYQFADRRDCTTSPLPTRLVRLQDPPNNRQIPQLQHQPLSSSVRHATGSIRLTCLELFRSIISELDTALRLLHRNQLFDLVQRRSEVLLEFQAVVNLAPCQHMSPGATGGSSLNMYFVNRHGEHLPYNPLEL
jgi:hypothetical protein